MYNSQPRPRWRGFSFALHRHGAGLLFLPGGVSASYNRLRLSFCRQCNLYHHNAKTVYRALQGLFRWFALFQRIQYGSRTSRLYTTCAAPEGIPSSAAPPPIPDTTAEPGGCTSQHSRPIIIMYIRVQRCAPVIDSCQAVQHSADHASGGGTVQRQGHGGRRGTTGGYRRIPFRAFAR